MSPHEGRAALIVIERRESTDYEVDHVEADEILLRVLKYFGVDLTEEFTSINRWYS